MLSGANITKNNRYGDLENKISVGTASGYVAKHTFKGNSPYSVMLRDYSFFDPEVNTEFKDNILYNLQYGEWHRTYNLDISEYLFWKEFEEYNTGTPKTGELLTAITTLNEWLTNDTLNIPHSTVRPTYTSKFEAVYINYHFLTGLRRQMSGDIAAGTSTFSPEETTFYNEYVEYSNGVVKEGRVLTAVEALDAWIIRELIEAQQPSLERDFKDSHSWYKLTLSSNLDT